MSKKNYWIIHGNKYYLDEYVNKHPGGYHAIMSGANRDCTELFESYHIFNDNHRKILNIYNNNKEIKLPEPDPIYEDFKNIIRTKYKSYKDLKMPIPLFIFYNITCLFQLYLISITNNLKYIFILGYFFSMFGMRLVHECGHFSLSKYNIINYLNQFIMFPFMGFLGWHHQHVIGHHQYTNVSKDPDMYFMSKYKIDKANNIIRTLFFIGLCWLSVFQYITHSFSLLIKGKSVGQKSMYPRYIIFLEIIICLYLNTFLNWTPLKYFTFMWGAGFEFLPTSQIAHLIVYPGKESENWVTQQIKESVNFGVNNNSMFWRIWFFGLNTQLEHHIFPGISHEHHYNISNDVKKVCKKHNIKYKSLTIKEGFCALIKRIWYGKPIELN